MLTFSQYVSEVYVMTSLSNRDTKDWFKTVLGKPVGKDFKFMSDMSNKHKLYTIFEDSKTIEFYVVGPENVVVMGIYAKYVSNKKSSTITIKAIKGKDNKLPAHKVYAHLIKKHNFIIESDKIQSYGGANIWIKLSKEPGINIHGWDSKTKEAINLGDRLDSVNMDTDTFMTTDDSGEGIAALRRITLVAHKK